MTLPLGNLLQKGNETAYCRDTEILFLNLESQFLCELFVVGQSSYSFSEKYLIINNVVSALYLLSCYCLHL